MLRPICRKHERLSRPTEQYYVIPQAQFKTVWPLNDSIETSDTGSVRRGRLTEIIWQRDQTRQSGQTDA